MKSSLKMSRKSIAVCQNCRVQCYKVYYDHSGGRTAYVVCPICGNGDPQLDINSCGLSENDLEANERLLRFMHGDDPDSEVDFSKFNIWR